MKTEQIGWRIVATVLVFLGVAIALIAGARVSNGWAAAFGILLVFTAPLVLTAFVDEYKIPAKETA